jgi:hypothetical protein
MAREAAQPVQRAAGAQSGVALNTSYEVQIFRDKRWRIDSMFDDRSLALYEGKRMNDSGRYVCVRVVEESFDEITGNTKLTTIYRGGRIEQAHQKDIDDAIRMRRDIRQQEGIAEKEAAEAAAAKVRASAKSNRLVVWLAIGFGAVGLLAGGGAVLMVLK